MRSVPPLRSCDLLAFDYPGTPRDPRDGPRFLLVTRILDACDAHVPAEPVPSQANPVPVQWLVCGIDLASESPARFWWEVMRRVRRLPWLTIGLYDPVQPRRRPLAPRGLFAPVGQDRRFVAAVLGYYRRLAALRENCFFCAAAFPVSRPASMEDPAPWPTCLRSA